MICACASPKSFSVTSVFPPCPLWLAFAFDLLQINSLLSGLYIRQFFLRVSVPPWLIFDFPHLPSAYSFPLRKLLLFARRCRVPRSWLNHFVGTSCKPMVAALRCKWLSSRSRRFCS